MVLLSVLLMTMPLQVKAKDSIVLTEGNVNTRVSIPDVTGMTESEAIKALSEVTLPNQAELEIIKSYAYSSVSADVVYEQSLVGEVEKEDAKSIHISISMGEEPKAPLMLINESVGSMSTFGLARYLDTGTDTSGSQFGIDWDSLPCSYEYNWDNSMMCWDYGVWINGVCYKTPRGEYSTDVRHKVQVYCDGTYLYTRIVFARDFWSTANGDNYRYFFDDKEAVFQFVGPKGNSLTNESKTMAVGTTQVGIQHSMGTMSSEYVNGAMAYLTKFESGINAILEAKIPLSEIVSQNPGIDMDTVGAIQFQSPNIMYRKVTVSGADTLPFVTAGVLFIAVPGSALLLRKYHKKRKRNEQTV